jgi:hypothetical protein
VKKPFGTVHDALEGFEKIEARRDSPRFFSQLPQPLRVDREAQASNLPDIDYFFR